MNTLSKLYEKDPFLVQDEGYVHVVSWSDIPMSRLLCGAFCDITTNTTVVFNKEEDITKLITCGACLLLFSIEQGTDLS